MMNIQGEYDCNTLISQKLSQIHRNGKVHDQEFPIIQDHVEENIGKAPNRAFAHIQPTKFKKWTRTKTTINPTTLLIH